MSMYDSVSGKTLLETINAGWLPTWFAIENSELSVDMCVDYRLNDGKVLFMRVHDTDLDALSVLAEQVADLAATGWAETMAKRKKSLQDSIAYEKKSQEKYRGIEWRKDHVYRFVYSKDNVCWFRCTQVEAGNPDYVYLQELVEAQYAHLSLFRKEEKPIQELISSETQVFDEGYQPGRTVI